MKDRFFFLKANGSVLFCCFVFNQRLAPSPIPKGIDSKLHSCLFANHKSSWTDTEEPKAQRGQGFTLSAFRTVAPSNFSLGVCGEVFPLYPSPTSMIPWKGEKNTRKIFH